MPQEEESPTTVTCPICGYESPEGSSRCPHCYNSLDPNAKEENADDVEPETEQERDLEELLRIPGVGETKAETLYDAGFHSLKDILQAGVEQLSEIKGIGEKLANKIVEGAKEISPAADSNLSDWLSGEDDSLTSWLSGQEKNDTEAAVTSPRDDTKDASLARWLSGQEEDVNSWLQDTSLSEAAEPREQLGPNERLAREAELIQLRETFREKLKQFESGDFDPQSVIEELAKVRAGLDAEKNRTNQLEEELENIKRGSLAVIKFIKNQQGSGADAGAIADKLASEMANRETLELKIMQLEEVVSSLKYTIENSLSDSPPDIQELKRKEIALQEREVQLGAMNKQLLAKEAALGQGMLQGDVQPPVQTGPTYSQVSNNADRDLEYSNRIQELESKLAEAELAIKHKDEMMAIVDGSPKAVDKEIARKLEQAQMAERTLVVREKEVQRLKEELRIRDEETQKLKEPMKYKEDEVLRREEDLMYRERLLQEEMKKVAQTKAELGDHDELALKKRLEELQAEVNEKEEEIRRKEKFLGSKEEELRLREQGVISDEIEKREQDRMLEVKQEKVKTGTVRLDDLLLGGIPFGSNVLIYGPPFTGKEVLVSVFMAEGLKKGIPALWILTEKSPKEIRNEMTFVVSGYEEYEKLGLVRYVDAYSRSMGDDSQDPYTDYVESPTDYESIQKAVETAAKQFKEKHKYYRVGFRSISTLIAYLDPATAFRFLSPVVGRRKRDGAVGMYTIEKGVHGEQEIQMIGSLMDGMIEFKIENLNTFLSVRGICDVQSRAYIRYSSTKVGVTIGSFSLDHIR
jgi:KaiC/GvpD/RAD55 family RecA-like ATPase